jgi:hypothetical protein
VAEANEARFGVAALAHLPKGCSVAGRVEWHALLNHPLLSALAEKAIHPDPGQIKTEEQRSFLAFLEQGKIDPRRDIEQIAFCFGSTQEPLVVVAGGLPKGLIGLMQTVAPKAERYKVEQKAGVAVLRRAGRSLLQADDRALLLGADLEQLLQARQLGSAYEQYHIPETGELALVAEGEMLNGTIGLLLPPPLGGLAQRARRAQVTFTLSTQQLRIAAELPSAEEAEVLKSSLSALVKAQLGPGAAAAPPKQALAREALRQAAESARWDVEDRVLNLRVTLPIAMLGMALATD